METTNRPRGFIRRHKKGSAIVAALVVLAVAGAALAALLLRAPLEGGGNISDGTSIRVFEASVVDQVSASCTVTVASGKATVNFTDLKRGGWCDFSFGVEPGTGATTAVRFSDVKFSDATNEWFLGSVCGQTVMTGSHVSVRVKAPTAAPLGPFTALTDAGIYATDDPGPLPGCPASEAGGH